MSQELLQIAMTKFSLVQGSTPAKSLLQDLADVTGIPKAALLVAERKMALRGGLEPLRALFTDPVVPKAERLKYKVGIKRIVKTPGPRRIDVCRMILDVESVKGRLQIAVDMVMRERPASGETVLAPPSPAQKQTAKLTISYRLLRGKSLKTFRQDMTLSRYAPELPSRPSGATVLFDTQATNAA